MRTRKIDRLLLFLARKSYSAAQRLTLTVPCKVRGMPLRVPFMYGIGLQNTRITPRNHGLAGTVRRVLAADPGAVIDVGCNIGHFMLMCLLADRERRYVGFDPSPACCVYIERFIQENRLTNHSVLPIGLADAMAVRELRTNGPFDVCASFSTGAHADDRFRYRHPLLVEQGDEVLSRMGVERVALIKIDVEGFELEVLQGLEATLRRERPFVIFEILPYADLIAEDRAEAGELGAVAHYRRQTALSLTRFFQRHGYVFHRIRMNGGLKPLVDLDPRDSKDHFEVDCLAIPRERAAAFLGSGKARSDAVSPERSASALSG